MTAFAAALLSASAPAAADDARGVMAAFVECIVNRAAYKIKHVLDLPVGGSGPQAQWAQLADEDCLAIEGSLRFKPNLMRGAVYEVLYRQEFGRSPVDGFEGLGPITYPVAAAEASAEAAQYRTEMAIGDCIVRKSPSEARTLVLSHVSSAGEDAAIQTMMPALTACVDQGHTITLSKSVIRGLTAETLYRLTVAKRDTSHA